MKLDREEKAIIKSIEKGEWRSVPNLEKEKARYRRYALATLRKGKRINIRISEQDLVLLQQRALDEGLPYQTLISSILHKFVSGRLRESTTKRSARNRPGPKGLNDRPPASDINNKINIIA